MFLKILLTLGLLLLAWAVFFRGRGGVKRLRRRRSKTPLESQTLVKCNRCGIYLPMGELCTCKDKA